MESGSAAKKRKTGRGWRTVGYVILLLVWVAASTIASQLVVGYLMLFLLGYESFTQPVWTAVYSALSYVVTMALIITVPLLIARKRHIDATLSRKTLGLRDLPTWTDIGLAPAGFIVYVLVAFLVTSLFSFFPWFDANQAQDVGFSVYISGTDRLIAFFTLVVVAPIAEEIIFRGWLYGKLRERLNQNISNIASMIVSTLIVSILFGVLHLQWNVGVNVFAMSLVLCGLREITGTIYAGILMHMVKNGVAFYLLYILGIG